MTVPPSGRALIATRDGVEPSTPAFEVHVAGLGYEPVDVLCQNRAEHNRYNLGPGLVDRIADRIATDDIEYLAVDHRVHPGQLVDLAERLPPVRLRDRRGVVREVLADGGNPVATVLGERQRRRVERRSVARSQRDGATNAPGGTDGRLDALDAELDRLDERWEDRTATQRRRIEDANTGADRYVAVTGPPTAPIVECWRALTGENAEATTVLGPATPKTARVRIASHDVAVTATTALLPALPEWFGTSVPGTISALSRADVIVTVGTGETDTLAASTLDRFDATHLRADLSSTEVNSVERLRERLGSAFLVERHVLTLPMTDEAMGLVSRCHDDGLVESVEYGETVSLTIAAPPERIPMLTDQVNEAGGTIERDI